MQVLRFGLPAREWVHARRRVVIGLSALLTMLAGPPAVAQNGSATRPDSLTAGVPSMGAAGVQRTTAAMMHGHAAAALGLPPARRMMRSRLDQPDRRHVPQHADAAAVATGAA